MKPQSVIAFILSLGIIRPATTSSTTTPLQAVAVLGNGNVGVSGIITFLQIEGHSTIYIYVRISGLTPGLHGLHIHEKGDLSGGCATLLSHYNPHGKTHGAPGDVNRHVGDLGNVLADNQGNVNQLLGDNVVSLCGDYSVIGRGIIIHNGTDDLGRGTGDSLATGNSGGRAACGVIGWA